MVEEVQEIKPISAATREGIRSHKGLIIAFIILILGGTAIFAGLKFLGLKNPFPDTKDEKNQNEAKAEEINPIFSLEPFIINLADNDGTRYLKITMGLELEKNGSSEEVKEKVAPIRDTILTLLTSKTFAEIKDVPGKFKLREQINSRVNTLLVSGRIRRVYFTEFVIQ